MEKKLYDYFLSYEEQQQLGKELQLPSSLVSDFKTEQDYKIAKIWKRDPSFEKTPLDFLFEEEMDKFTNELRISTFRSRSFKFPYSHPIDLLYISKPEGEQFYVLYTADYSMSSSGALIFNIDGRTNCNLSIDYDDIVLGGKTHEDAGALGCVSFLPISKKDFLKCCNAEHLTVRIKSDSSLIDYESDCDEIIPYFQMLYNKVCDNTMFAENKETWKNQMQERFEKTVAQPINEKIKWDKEWEKEYNTRRWVIIIGGIVLALIIIIGMIGLI